MARADTTLTSLGFRTRTLGIVTLQQTVKHNAEKANELIADLRTRVLNLETAANDSNSAHFNGDPG